MDRLTDVPHDLPACQHLLRELFSRLDETASTLDSVQQENRQLREELQLFRRMLFGPRRERVVEAPNQQHLFDLGGVPEPRGDEPSQEYTVRRRRRRQAGHGWGEFPAHLPREERRHDVPEAHKLCTCCGQPRTCIGEDINEVLDCVPARMFVVRHIYPKYACPVHKEGVFSAPVEPKLVEGGRFGFGVATEVVTSKFALHLPLYRQQDQFASAGIELSRSTLCDLVRASAERLRPLAERLRALALESSVMWTDDTPVLLQLPEKGTCQARFWAYLGDESRPYDVYDFTTNRERSGPATFLRGYRGYLHADAYGGYDGIYLGSNGAIQEVACWSHTRRKFYDARESSPRQAHQVLGWIRQLYDIEDRASLLDAAGRQALRQREAVPILDRIESWLAAPGEVLPKSALGKAVTYARNQWQALRRYTTDGRLTIDNNASERRVRAQAIGRKNWLFVGAEQAGHRAALLYTVISSAKRHDLDIWAYVRDALERLTRGEPDVDALLPNRWKADHPEAVRTYRQHEREAKAAAKRGRRQQRRQRERAPPSPS
jgi:transposase